ncbi:uncharacterized protein [Ptychodera flava]|uniref:uncharacterized protein n=1 Tax=Ptychodera flava TaxID=63121 RepID=UPI00396AB15E
MSAAMAALRGIKITVTATVLSKVSSRWLSSKASLSKLEWLLQDVNRFQIDLPVERASTPPATWYTDPAYHDLELDSVFRANWLPVGRVDQVTTPGRYFTGSIGCLHYVVLHDNNGRLSAFHNVCRHRGMLLCREDDGHLPKFSCPYHGWTYDLSGRLTKARQLRGIQGFSARDFGLKPLGLTKWGPLVFIADELEEAGSEDTFHGELESLLDRLREYRFTDDWKFVKRTKYTLNCNWKVVCDNILDNGYHVTATHPEYSKLLDLSTLKTEILGRSSLCTVASLNKDGRVSGDVMLAHVYPNLVINRYGNWMDTNIVVPLSHSKCEIIYDYYLLQEFVDSLQYDATAFENYVEESLKDSHCLQEEDNLVCEGVQKGLQSISYDVGRYSPSEEKPDHNFHTNIAKEFRKYLGRFKTQQRSDTM